MQQDLFIRRDLTIPGAERGSGDSRWWTRGQHVNKAATKITLRVGGAQHSVASMATQSIDGALGISTHKEGDVVIHVHQHRSQQRNLDAARERLVSWIQQALEGTKACQVTKPTRASKKRRVDAKETRSVKRDGDAFAMSSVLRGGCMYQAFNHEVKARSIAANTVLRTRSLFHVLNTK